MVVTLQEPKSAMTSMLLAWCSKLYAFVPKLVVHTDVVNFDSEILGIYSYSSYSDYDHCLGHGFYQVVALAVDSFSFDGPSFHTRNKLPCQINDCMISLAIRPFPLSTTFLSLALLTDLENFLPLPLSSAFAFIRA